MDIHLLNLDWGTRDTHARHGKRVSTRASRAADRRAALLRSPRRYLRARLEDGGRGAAGEAAGRVERVDAEELVEQAAGDAEHGRAAVLALRVELEGLDLGVVVAHPRDAGDVPRLGVVGLRLRGEAGASLLHAGE